MNLKGKAPTPHPQSHTFIHKGMGVHKTWQYYPGTWWLKTNLHFYLYRETRSFFIPISSRWSHIGELKGNWPWCYSYHKQFMFHPPLFNMPPNCLLTSPLPSLHPWNKHYISSADKVIVQINIANQQYLYTHNITNELQYAANISQEGAGWCVWGVGVGGAFQIKSCMIRTACWNEPRINTKKHNKPVCYETRNEWDGG